MSDNPITKLWARIQDFFLADAEHLVKTFIPEPATGALKPNDSYIRLTLSEMFVQHSVKWGTQLFPAVQASTRLLFGGGEPKTFATLARPPEGRLGPGVYEDYRMTYLLPYLGQDVEFEVGLYAIAGDKNLSTAVDIIGDFASLVAPPLASAVSVMDKLASGIERVIAANNQKPRLALHAALMPGGGEANAVRPGWLVVVRASEQELPKATLHIVDGRLHRTIGSRTEQLTGFDYLVVRVEGFATRATDNEWRSPDLDTLINGALLSRDLERADFAQLREAALTKIYFSPDFTPSDRKRIAMVVKEELDDNGKSGAVAAGARHASVLADVVARRGLPSRTDADDLDLTRLLSV